MKPEGPRSRGFSVFRPVLRRAPETRGLENTAKSVVPKDPHPNESEGSGVGTEVSRARRVTRTGVLLRALLTSCEISDYKARSRRYGFGL